MKLSLLGPFQVFLDGEAVTSFESNKVRVLLAVLAAEGERPQRRELLADLLLENGAAPDALREYEAVLKIAQRRFNATAGASNCFALSSQGERVYLFSADLSGNLTGYDHGFAFGAAGEGVAFGRHVISTGEEQFPLQRVFTPGATNAGPLIGPLVITEIMYHAPTTR